MAHSQRSGRLRVTRRARRPDGGVYRTLRVRRLAGRTSRLGAWALAVLLVLASGVVWVLLWR